MSLSVLMAKVCLFENERPLFICAVSIRIAATSAFSFRSRSPWFPTFSLPVLDFHIEKQGPPKGLLHKRECSSSSVLLLNDLIQVKRKYQHIHHSTYIIYKMLVYVYNSLRSGLGWCQREDLNKTSKSVPSKPLNVYVFMLSKNDSPILVNTRI